MSNFEGNPWKCVACTLSETNIASENRPEPKRREVSQPPFFRGEVLGSINICPYHIIPQKLPATNPKENVRMVSPLKSKLLWTENVSKQEKTAQTTLQVEERAPKTGNKLY